MRRFLVLIILVFLATPASAADEFQVRFDGKWVDVQACFDGAAPRELYRSSRAEPFASRVTAGGEALATRGRGSTLRLPVLPDNACIEWRVNLAAAANSGDYRTAFRSGGALGSSAGLWLWKGPWRRPLNVRVELREGASFSAPWPSAKVDGKRVYTPARTPASWPSRTLFGRLAQRELQVPGATVHLAMTGDMSPQRQDLAATWIRSAVESVVPVFGYFPRAQVQVVVVPIGRRGDPVPWAHVMRGGGPAVEFFIDETRSLDALQLDWTATHEFSHLLLPYVTSRDRWLSEGLASYYQNVLRARDGRISEMQAWQKLHDGFQRGERGTRSGTLAEVARAGGSNMRVYWSGAAMLLKADTRLRELSADQQSLDSVLEQFNRCCRESGKAWRARDLMEELDRLSGTGVFTDLYRQHVHTEEFPDVREVYRDLGLDTRLGRLRPVDDAPLESIREAIMAPGPG